MSEAPVPVSVPPVWPMYRALVGVGLVCGFLIVSVYEVTRPVIEPGRLPGARRSGRWLAKRLLR